MLSATSWEGHRLQNQITEMIYHMANSQEEMADIIEAKRHVIVHLSLLNHQISHVDPNFGEIQSLMKHSLLVTKSITSYLNSLAELEDAMTENLSCLMKEMEEEAGEE
jgi:methyl-accepting chemotaxis protein